MAEIEVPKPDTCPICRQGTPRDVIAELPQVWVTAQTDAPLPGYVCIVGRTHVREPFELSEPERVGFWRDVDAVARSIAGALQPTKLNYEIHGDAIPHLHLHLLPRFLGDPFEGRPIDPSQTAPRSPDEIDRLRVIAARYRRGRTECDPRRKGVEPRTVRSRDLAGSTRHHALIMRAGLVRLGIGDCLHTGRAVRA